jgi:hypothetical protein
MRKRGVALVLVLLMVASTLAVATTSSAVGGDEDRAIIISNGDELLVVAPRDWEKTLQPLMDWRLRTSDFVPKFVAFEDAMAYGNGHDAAAKLKSYLPIPFIEMGDWGHMALLLVGDAEVLPVRYVFTDILQDGNLSDPLNYRWTDDYYAYGYEFEWDRDGDGIYGEDGEVLSDLPGTFNSVNRFDWSVGRIPASSNLELERYVQKLLDYEQDPPPTSGLIVSGLMDVPNHLDNPYTPDLDGGYELFSDNSWESHTKLQDILPDRYDNTWLYDYPHLEGGHWSTPWTTRRWSPPSTRATPSWR